MIERILTPAIVDALGWTLVHALWQGAAFALLLALLLIVLRRYSAQARYVVAVGLFASFFITTVLTFIRVYQPGSEGGRSVATAMVTLAESTAGTKIDQSSSAEETAAAPTSTPTPPPEADRTLLTRIIQYYDTHLPLIVTGWLLGVLVLLLRLLGQLAFVLRLKSYGASVFPDSWRDRLEELEARLGIYRKITYRLTVRAASPLTFGWLRPVVLFPKELFHSLEDTQIYAILAHELAHVKRHDFLVNLIQQMVRTLFFFHPGVWWMSERIEEEREHSCDDLAVGITQQPLGYAKTILHLSENQMKTTQLAMAYAGPFRGESGGLRARILRLLGNHLNTATYTEGIVTACIFGCGLLLAVQATGQAPPTDPQASAAVTTAEPEPDNEITTTIGTADTEAEATAASVPGDAAPKTDFELLLEAIDDGNLKLVRYFLEQGVDVNGISSKGRTALMAAAEERQSEIARLLIERGAAVNLANGRGWTALLEAAAEGSSDVARILIAAGADVDYTTPYSNMTALALAAEEGQAELIELLLDAGADPATGPAGISPLHLAAAEGHADVVRKMLDLGLDVDLLDRHNRTPLSYAAEEGHESVVELLLRRGADSKKADQQGRTPLNYSAEEGHGAILDMHLDADASLTADELDPNLLLDAAAEGQLSIVNRLLEFGMAADSRGEAGRTALMLAAAENHVAVVRRLLEAGADVNARVPESGWSPLLYAAREGNAAIAEMLADRGADLEARVAYRDNSMSGTGGKASISFYRDATPLLVAIAEAEPQTVAALLEAGADPNTTMNKVFLVIREKIDWQTLSTIDPDDTAWSDARYDTAGWTPLMEAVAVNAPSIVSLLLAAGADRNARAADGTTALSLAEDLGHEPVARLLR